MMKKTAIVGVLSLWAMVTATTQACDACMSSAALNETGLVAALRHHFLSLSWTHESSTTMRPFGIPPKNQLTAGHLQGRFFLTDRWSVSFNQSLHLNQRVAGEHVQTISGAGDLWLTSGYRYGDWRLDCGLAIQAEALAGLRLPLGKWQADIETTQDLPRAFNPGRGSWAGQLQHRLVLRYYRWGLFQQLTSTRSAPTSDGYRFGTTWQATTLVYRSFDKGKPELTPYLGLVYEHLAADTYATGMPAHGTGGEGWWVQAGLMLRLEPWALTLSTDLPVETRYANGDVQPEGRLRAGLVRFF